MVIKMKRLALILLSAVFTVSALPLTASALVVNDKYRALNNLPWYEPGDVPSSCLDTTLITTGTNVADVGQYIDLYGQLAFNTGKNYGLPYEAIIAQSYLESGRGNSVLTKEANNFFGIKAGSSWTGDVYRINTEEENPDGSRVTVEAVFRAYPTPQAGFDGYGSFIRNTPRYQPALAYYNNPSQYINELKKAGYATDSEYVQKNIEIQQAAIAYIKEKNLFPPSSEVFTSPPNINTGSLNNDSANSIADCIGVLGSGKLADIIRIAEQELAKKPVEYDSNVMLYTLNRREHWCADFVSYVFKSAGLSFTGGWSQDWQLPSVSGMQAWFKQGINNSEYFSVGEKDPRPGDVAFYVGSQTPDRSSTSHVNIVISVNGSEMTTIGGNESDMVKKTTRRVEFGANSLVGFGRMVKSE